MIRFVLLSLVLIAPVHGQMPAARIDPAGIAGHLLVCGAALPSDVALLRSLDLAGGAKAKVLVVHAGDAPPKAFMDRLTASAKNAGASVAATSVKALGEHADDKSTCVWILNRADSKDLTDYCTALLARKGVVALGAEALPTAAAILPRCELFLGEARVPQPGNVAIAVTPQATLWIHQRDLKALSERVLIELRASETTPGRQIAIEGKQAEDLTALRRAALARSIEPFPPQRPGMPDVPKGALFIVGGGGTPAGMFPKFVEAAKQAGKPNIVILPTAIPDPIPNRDSLVDIFKKAGASKVTILKGRTLAEVESKDSLEALREAGGIWFDGGRQWRFVDAYEGTKAHALMVGVLERGGVIGGTSAGATIQGDYLCRGSPFGNLEIRYEGYERGLGFLPGVAIDQHFSQRKRFADMTSLMKTYPQLLGIGIDESTALIVRGHVGLVSGKGKVYFYDRNQTPPQGSPDYVAIADGGRYDLKARKTLTEK